MRANIDAKQRPLRDSPSRCERHRRYLGLEGPPAERPGEVKARSSWWAGVKEQRRRPLRFRVRTNHNSNLNRFLRIAPFYFSGGWGTKSLVYTANYARHLHKTSTRGTKSIRPIDFNSRPPGDEITRADRCLDGLPDGATRAIPTACFADQGIPSGFSRTQIPI